tara:strand:+ start:431 stop:571 length:141 start_codon:yes stop_codon:yes gene_type:complete
MLLNEYQGICEFAGSIATEGSEDNTQGRGLYCALYRVRPTAARENA